VITAAAAIMVVVFGSFALEDDRLIKMLGTGLATAVLLDVTLVRMVLVPATMELLGARNWWMPAWLDRIVPRLSVERRERGGRRDADPSPAGSGARREHDGRGEPGDDAALPPGVAPERQPADV
jgi:RND superfamily putative drug exporter